MSTSFDMDNTLGEFWVQLIAKAMIAAGHEVWIVTARCDDRLHNPNIAKINSCNRDLFAIAERLGIPDDRIVMTEGDFKHKTIKRLGIELHFDDVPEEVELINRNTDCKALLIWDEFCSSSIKHEQFGKGLF